MTSPLPFSIKSGSFAPSDKKKDRAYIDDLKWRIKATEEGYIPEPKPIGISYSVVKAVYEAKGLKPPPEPKPVSFSYHQAMYHIAKKELYEERASCVKDY